MRDKDYIVCKKSDLEAKKLLGKEFEERKIGFGSEKMQVIERDREK